MSRQGRDYAGLALHCADEDLEIQSSGELAQAWTTAVHTPTPPSPAQRHIHSARPLPLPVAQSAAKPLPSKGGEKESLWLWATLFICVQGEVWLFLRVLIRKLPGSPFSLSFFLLLRWAGRAGASEKKGLVVLIVWGGRWRSLLSTHVWRWGKGWGSAPQVTGQGLAG